MKCALIVNPAAGRRDPAAAVGRLRRLLEERDHSVDVTVTTRRGDAEMAARRAAIDGLDALVVAGGDGTLNEVVNGALGTSLPVCVIPCGTVNVLALELGLPLDAEAACALVGRGARRAIDVGIANGRAFFLACGAGLDAAVVARTSLWLKRRSGRMAYLVAGLTTLARIRPARYHLEIDGCEIDAALYQVLASNTTRYAGQFRLLNDGAIDDGLLDVYLFHAHGRVRLAQALLAILRGGLPSGADVERIAARTLTSAPNVITPTQLDGDSFATTPLSVCVKPGALTVLVPQAP